MRPLNPDVGMYLMERYPGVVRVGLQSMWIAAWAWIEERASPQYLIKSGDVPPVFEAIALLRVQHICAGNDLQAKAALNFAAHELIAPYR